MQTILGSSGQIGQELAKELYKSYTQDIRLVSRNPKKINEADQLFKANLLDFDETNASIAGSEIVYFAVGLPMDSTIWEKQFMVITKNVIEECKRNHSKLVFFDNTYMYPKDEQVQLENSSFVPEGRKSTVRSDMAKLLMNEMDSGKLNAVICRAPEFYGPSYTQSITNTLIFNNIKEGKIPKIPISDKTARTLIWTPDASRAMALIGNTPDSYGQTWHLPCEKPLTYQRMIELIQDTIGKQVNYKIIKMWKFKIASLFSKNARELQELLPRYKKDNIFSSDKFKNRFPDFEITSFEEVDLGQYFRHN